MSLKDKVAALNRRNWDVMVSKIGTMTERE